MAKIISFHGIDHKVGTTQLSAGVFEVLGSQFPDKDILLINADGEFGFDFYDKRSFEYESLLEPTNIDETIIKSKSYLRENLFVINLSSLNLSLEPDSIETLISNLSGMFDYIVIDAGASNLNGTNLGALFISDFIYLVFNQNESSFRKFEYTNSLYKKLNVVFNAYIINQYDKKNIYDQSYISERLKVSSDEILIVKNIKNLKPFDAATKPLINCKGTKTFVKDLKQITEDIVNYARLQD